MVGKSGLTDGVLMAAQEALLVHELLKVSLPADSGGVKKVLVRELCTGIGAHLIQEIGHIAVVFRQRNKRSAFELPKVKEKTVRA